MIGCLTSKSEALFTSWLFFNMAAENRFVVFVSFNRVVGILKDNATTQDTKLQRKSGYIRSLTIIIYQQFV